MMKLNQVRVAVIMVLALLASQAFSQPIEADGTGKISGVVVDGTNEAPVEYATIAVNDPATGSPVNGTVADDKGKFSISKIPYGSYNIVISFLGFEPKSIPVTLGAGQDNIDLGTVKIDPKAEVLQEVTVQGQRDLIEERVDRTIYNAEKDETTRGGDATDVLRRVPLLTVDFDGNLSMRGSSNVKVLINNRPSTITAGSVADALKQIPAEEIKSVEVITSPSAKYDAEGTAGIINIITKKNVLEGATLGINSSAGLRGSNLGLNGAYRQGKVGVSLGGWGRAGYNVLGSFENQQTTNFNGTESLNIQRADTRSNMMFGRYTLGLDYDFDKNNFLNTSFRYGLRNFHSFQDDRTTETYVGGTLTDNTLSDVDNRNNSGGFDFSMGFTHLYTVPDREWSFLGLYSRDDRRSEFLNQSLDTSTEDVISQIKNVNPNLNEEITLQTDYQTPIGKTQLVELGVKGIQRNVVSDYNRYEAQGEGTVFTPSALASYTNVFNYDQMVSAAYVSYTLQFLQSYTVKAGTRYEYTTTDASFADEVSDDIPDYGVMVPSVNLSRKLKSGNMIKAAYNRRIQRPSIRFLNPNIDDSNPLNISMGNPDLNPEYTDNYELSYSTFIKGTMLNFSTFYRNTDNAIQSISEVIGQDTILTTFRNIGHEDAYGFSIFANINISNKFSLNGGTDVNYSILDDAAGTRNEGWVAGYRLFGNYEIKNGWGFQFFGFYRGRRVSLQGSQGGFGIYSLNLKKDFDEKRGSIGFGAENFLTSGFKMKSELNSPTLSQQSTNIMHNMNFKINLSYRIGKLGSDPNAARRSRRSISNDDLKMGDSNDMGAGDMQPQQQTPRPQRRGIFRSGQSQQGQQGQQEQKSKGQP